MTLSVVSERMKIRTNGQLGKKIAKCFVGNYCQMFSFSADVKKHTISSVRFTYVHTRSSTYGRYGTYAR